MDPNLKEEEKLWRKGYKRVACIDEAGVGPLAGPVVAAAVVIAKNLKLKIKNLPIKDSKKLSPKSREKFYKILTSYPGIEWGVGIVSEKIIDKINIFEATKLASEKAVKKLKKKPNFLILDGRIKLPLKIPQKPIIKADEKVFSCAAASIIAKVTRDRIMIKYYKKYPGYRFDLHKGYGTSLHMAELEKYGPSQIHRKSFWPVYKYYY